MSEMPECIVYRTPKARKEHRCCECRGVILVGESYQRVSGIWDGEPMRFKTCCDCAAIRDKIEPQDTWETVCFEGLHEWLVESDDADGLLTQFRAVKEKRKKVLPTP